MDSQTLPHIGAVCSLFDMQQEVAYSAHVALYEVRIKTTPDGWLAILKATNRREWLVAFIGGRDFHTCLSNLAKSIEDKDIHWRGDDYPPAWRAKQLGVSL